MPVYALFIWIIIGLLVGWKGLTLLGKSPTKSPLTNMVIATIGAIVGGYVMALFGGGLGFSLLLSLAASVGAVYAANLLLKK